MSPPDYLPNALSEDKHVNIVVKITIRNSNIITVHSKTQTILESKHVKSRINQSTWGVFEEACSQRTSGKISLIRAKLTLG